MEIPATLLMTSAYAYVAVKGSIHASTACVFGLNEVEVNALSKRFHNYREDVINGISLKASPISIINALGELGYTVVASSGESEVIWTMQRDI